MELQASGELRPQSLTQTGRREITHLLRTHELGVSAIFCPLRHGLDEPQDLEPRLEQIRLTMSLAYDLGPRLVILQPGPIPEDAPAEDVSPPTQTSGLILGSASNVLPPFPLKEGPLHFSPLPLGEGPGVRAEHPRAALMKESLAALGKHGDRIGVIVALDTGHDEPARLAAYLDRFDTGSLAVNLNPANLVLGGFSPYAALRLLSHRIAHVHAQDARRISPSKLATVSLGHGDIDWMQLLSDFKDVEYRGYVSVQGDSEAELSRGVAFLRRFAS